jgi:hypothetical protein
MALKSNFLDSFWGEPAGLSLICADGIGTVPVNEFDRLCFGFFPVKAEEAHSANSAGRCRAAPPGGLCQS